MTIGDIKYRYESQEQEKSCVHDNPLIVENAF
jgi:hypothetical protein